jgi:hypothetical protein
MHISREDSPSKKKSACLAIQRNRFSQSAIKLCARSRLRVTAVLRRDEKAIFSFFYDHCVLCHNHCITLMLFIACQCVLPQKTKLFRKTRHNSFEASDSRSRRTVLKQQHI